MAILQNDIIYFILTDRFYGVNNPEFNDRINKNDPFKYHGGNFEGIIERIPYLKKLGITALWITPVYLQIDLKNVDGYHGYWPLDFNSINPSLYLNCGKYPKGSKKYLKDLVDELHKNGIKLVLDMVVNHTGYSHPSLTGAENPTPIKSTWFNAPNLSSEQDEIQGQLASLPDLDLDLPDVCDYHIQSIIDWIKETGIDAIRMDTVKHIERDFWNYFKTQVKGLYPDVNLIGEVLVFDVNLLSIYQKNWAFDELFDFPLQQAIREVFVDDKPLTQFVSPMNSGSGILEFDKHYTNHNRLVTLLDNHDLSARFYTYILDKQQNDYEKATSVFKLALTFLFTIRGIPQIYYGTEVGMEGHHDPDNRRDFPWELFTDDYQVKNEYKHQKEIFEYSCKLIELRKTCSALHSGMFVCLHVDYFLLVFLRYLDNEAVIVAFHNGWEDMPAEIEVSFEKNSHIPTRVKENLKSKPLKSAFDEEMIHLKNGIIRLKLKSKSVRIFL